MPERSQDKRKDFEKIFRQFKIRCKREGILKECRERQFYTKPSQKKRKNAKKRK